MTKRINNLNNRGVIISLFDAVFDFYLAKKISKTEMIKKCEELFKKYGDKL